MHRHQDNNHQSQSVIIPFTLFLNENRENWEHYELFTFVNYPIIIWEKADVKLKISTIFAR